MRAFTRRLLADYTVILVDPDRPRRRLADRHFWTHRAAVEWASLNADLFSVAIVRARLQGAGWGWVRLSGHYSITRARDAAADRDRILTAAGIPARWMRIVDAVNGRVVVVKPVGADKGAIEPPRPQGAP